MHVPTRPPLSLLRSRRRFAWTARAEGRGRVPDAGAISHDISTVLCREFFQRSEEGREWPQGVGRRRDSGVRRASTVLAPWGWGGGRWVRDSFPPVVFRNQGLI